MINQSHSLLVGKHYSSHQTVLWEVGRGRRVEVRTWEEGMVRLLNSQTVEAQESGAKVSNHNDDNEKEKKTRYLYFCNKCFTWFYEEECVVGPDVLLASVCRLRGDHRCATQSLDLLLLLSLPHCPYLALAEPLSTLRTAWAMASRSMPKIRSSSWGFPLRGTWATARRWTVKPASFTTAAHTASPSPPGESGDVTRSALSSTVKLNLSVRRPDVNQQDRHHPPSWFSPLPVQLVFEP